ncbi:hypothetical protein OQA88_3164 [Cercophora sp. LCS_1]
MNNHVLIKRQEQIIRTLARLTSETRALGTARAHDIENLTEQFSALFQKLDKPTARNEDAASPNEGLQGHWNEPMEQFCPKAEKIIQFSHEIDILKLLAFDGMDDRHIAILPAHERTLSWIFAGSASQSSTTPQVDFVNWLKSDDPFYWVSGKPGSGKSTMMKYIYHHPKLREFLSAWAGTNPLVIASFFFWDLGKDALRKSQLGLLRCILYQIFRRHPNLMQHALADDSDDIQLSVEYLLQALQCLPAEFSTSDIRYCFLIDGLDEYQGKPADVIQLIEILRSLPHVKLIVSSRPWNDFEKVFGEHDDRKIYMERLTRSDIDSYVWDTFDHDPSFREMQEIDGEECLALITEIVNSANGGFLWVRLVVQSLLEGITNADRMVDLQKRLRALPTDLEEFFRRIVFTVDPFYREQTSKFFQVTIKASATLPLMLYWFIDQDDTQYAMRLAAKPFSMQATNARLKQVRKRLNACCKGLLEVQFYDTGDVTNSSLSSSVLFNWKVDFLHRTARDFLLTESMQKQLDEWTPSEFSVDAAICTAILAQVKSAPQEEEYPRQDGPVERLVRVPEHHDAAPTSALGHPSTRDSPCLV